MRKTLALIFLIIIINNNLNAQPFQSVFGDSITFHTSTFSGLTIGSIFYYIQGDTVLNGVAYKRVNYSFNKPYFGSILGAIREDTITGKVWYRSIASPSNQHYTYPGDTIEKLVMDMSLNKGDSFIVGDNFFTKDTIIVDTVYWANGRKHIEFNDSIRYNYQSGGYRFSFIEGLGTSFGLCYKDSNNLHPMSASKFDGRLICFYKDSIHIYTMPVAQDYGGSCIPPAVINDDEQNNIVDLYPNPTTGIFTLSLPDRTTKVAIFNITGLTITEITEPKHQYLTIDLSGKPKGVYIVCITNTKGIVCKRLTLQ